MKLKVSKRLNIAMSRPKAKDLPVPFKVMPSFEDELSFWGANPEKEDASKSDPVMADLITEHGIKILGGNNFPQISPRDIKPSNIRSVIDLLTREEEAGELQATPSQELERFERKMATISTFPIIEIKEELTAIIKSVKALEDSGRSIRLSQEEFDKTVFSQGIQGIHKGEIRTIIRINRSERLISFHEYYDPQASWVRCESVSLIKVKQ